MMNKKGNIFQIVSIMGTVLMVLCFVFMFALGGVVVKNNSGIVFDEIKNLEINDDINMSELTEPVLDPIETIINNYALYAAVLYILGIIFIFTMAFIFRGNVHIATISLFVVSALLIIVFAIILSNTYETFYSGTDLIGSGLREAGVINYLILHSPAIMTVIIFIAGIIMMTGKEGGY